MSVDFSEVEKNVSPAAAANIRTWLEEEKYAEYRSELETLIAEQDWSELESSFFKVLEFGTAGRRGQTGVGSNRINRVTIGESAQALCDYTRSLNEHAPSQGVVIAYDTRLSSPELSRYVAQVCAANGFRTYLFDGYRSTPELSFAVRDLGCALGIVISASHNPPADNGFKAYWNDGAQLVAPHDAGVLAVAAHLSTVNAVDFDAAVDDGRIEMIGEDVDARYIAAVLGEAEGVDRDLSIVYSPLHGAGQRNTLPVLKDAGFKVSPVESQMVPDGNFPTIANRKPNPEERGANDLAVAQLLAEQADLAITNDPDADRIGVMVRANEKVVYLSGNQVAVLATDFVLQRMKARHELTNTHYLAKTIVTTDMLDALAESYGIAVYGNLLIGFKYIGELIRQKEETDERFVLGGEESFGMLKGTYARDKDGAVGALLLAEYAAELKASGKTLHDRLLELFREHGVYQEYLATVICPGASGFQQMQAMMNTLRVSPPASVAGHPVSAILDYQALTRTSEGQTHPIDSITSDIVVLEFEGDARCRITVRPSGTEPKLKLYVQWYQDADEDVSAQFIALESHLASLASELEGSLVAA